MPKSYAKFCSFIVLYIFSEKRVKEDIYLVPFAMAELGFIKMKQNNAVEAKELLEPAR